MTSDHHRVLSVALAIAFGLAAGAAAETIAGTAGKPMAPPGADQVAGASSTTRGPSTFRMPRSTASIR